MYALAGMYDPDASRLDIECRLERMRRTMEAPGRPARVEAMIAEGVGCVLLGHSRLKTPWVARDERHGLAIIVAGELFGRDARDSGTDESASDADLCLRLYTRDGADFVRRLNGHFNVFIYRASERRLSIATDPFGYHPLFVAAHGRRLLFASEMKAILAVLGSAPAIDGVGLLELVRHGWPLGDRTWIEPIKLAPPGTWYELTPTGMQQRRYFRFHFHHTPGTASLPEYVEALGDKLRRAMERATGTARIGIALSGGLDSRALLLAAQGHDQPSLAYTFGDAQSPDVRGARELARIAGIPHLHLTYTPGYLGRWLASIVWRTDGLLPFSEATFTSMHFHDTLAAHVDGIIYGHAGDALTGAHLPNGAPLWRSTDRVIVHVLRRYNRVPERLLQRVFRSEFYQRLKPDLYESLRASVAGIEQDDGLDILNVWDMENRQRRGTYASAAVDRGRFRVCAPFLERDLAAHLAHAHPLWRLQQIAYKRMIATGFPHAAAVPWAHTGSRLRSQRGADFALQARGYVQRRLWPAAARRNAFRDLRADTRADPQVAHVIREFAASSSLPDAIFNRAGIADVVHRHWEAGEDLTHLVSMLATFASAYQLLLWQRPAAPPPEALPAA